MYDASFAFLPLSLLGLSLSACSLLFVLRGWQQTRHDTLARIYQPVLLRHELPHDLRHLLGLLHHAFAWAAGDLASVTVYVSLRFHEPAESRGGHGRYSRHPRKDHRGRDR